MSDVRKFKFVSPGIFLNEIDNSQLPQTPRSIGPVVIGTTRKGPGMRPVQVNSQAELIEYFGEPSPGTDTGGDVFRNNALLSPTYASYAAMAYLKNSRPVNVVRLLESAHADADDTVSGQSGWTTKDSSGNELSVSTDAGGAYGLFVLGVDTVLNDTSVSGTLAAVFYTGEDGIMLSGSTVTGPGALTGTALMVTPNAGTGVSSEFTAVISHTDGSDTKVTFNLNRDSNKFIRKVFNTNPTLTNPSVTSTSNQVNYWLGETYEGYVDRVFSSKSLYGLLLPLSTTTGSIGSNQYSDHKFSAQSAETGWVFANDVTNDPASYDPDNMQKLFKLITFKSGITDMHNIKVSIENIKPPTNVSVDPFGTFSVVIRDIRDNDAVKKVLERFDQCNLNPASTNYVARKIGDKFKIFNTLQRRLVEYGQYANNSKYVRVLMNTDIDAVGPSSPSVLPAGFYGPPKPLSFNLISPGETPSVDGTSYIATSVEDSATNLTNLFVSGGVGFYESAASPVGDFRLGVGDTSVAFTASIAFPEMPLVVSASDKGLANPTDAYFGVDVARSQTSNVFDETYLDLCRTIGGIGGVSSTTFPGGAAATGTEYSFIFSMEDIVSTGSAVFYESGSNVAGTSISAQNGGYEAVLSAGYDRFTMPVYGGFDGFDITEKNPFRDVSDGKTEKNSSAFNSIKQAIDLLRDPEEIEFNLAAIPGVTEPALTNRLIDVCESRGDALAVIDIENDYTPSSDTSAAFQDRIGSVTSAVTSMKVRGLNTSYGAAYYPYVQVVDELNNQLVWMPPSVVALGTMANSERKSKVWFAPAGFNRGGLSSGAAGIPVIGVTQKLTAQQRDDLYEVNVNPIASFPSEGIVVFGQKTLQASQSALDRINVRRLLIYIKKRVSQIASGVIFDQNVRVTWNDFSGKVESFLRSVKTDLGLTDFKVVLDESTTTPDLIDRNILYAKVFLKPARAIEYIAVDFNITRTGASFVD